MDNLERIGNTGLVPVVAIENADDAVDAARALIAGGIDVIEITMRTPAGIEAIKNIRKAVPEMLVGAGTILSLEKCKEAVQAGAQFIVSPGLNPVIVKWCLENDITVTPGCVTPTEIDTALSLGLKTVKFFPAEVFGGIKGCAALYGPYQSAGIKFIPTGGVSNENLTEFADKPYIHAVGGGWLCKTSDIKEHKYSAITENAKIAVKTLLGFEVAHLGINQDSEEESISVAHAFNNAFDFQIKEGNSSNFVSDAIEITKSKFLGRNGHIAVKTNSIPRAIAYLNRKGIEVDMSTAKTKGDRLISVYLKDEFGGFAVHLLQK
ncbi:MAG TPA: bifunctional 4-hydroxy-2-oxoglutarate aldolase/2-dehydro-3-deoxy-phosphogluconate aldolase [Anaerolineaceae bacterium]|nr:bifunctional 4-hydroxy-2-oxoglutarate aldolase/2-dehydro-3-deoxy-phosphogluconate aldolase [Anaerolineaceae bacterium]